MPKGNMRNVDPGRYSMVPRSDVPRSAFDVRHMHKTTFGPGLLIPIYVDEVLPGDSLRLKMHAFARTSTALVPIIDNMYFESFFFFVPNRLVWSNWERFMGEMASPTDSTNFLVPEVPVAMPAGAQSILLTIYDYMGITGNGTAGFSVNALPFRAYNLIWNEFFRDQDIQSKVTENLGDGPDLQTDYNIKFRGKRHDYFTSARPWPFKPLPGSIFSGSFDPLAYSGNFRRPAAGAPVSGLSVLSTEVAAGAANGLYESGERIVDYSSRYSSDSDILYVRSTATGAGAFPDLRVLIGDLRIANTVQQYLEKAARGGSRYTEIVRSLFGVVSPDARLQRPEYLGGGRSMVTVHPVTQTAPTGIAGTTTELGEQAGTGVIHAYDHGFSRSFTEHGYILGLVNVRADLTYQQGVQRLFNRRTMFDFYSPPFAHLGEQAVQRKEIYANGVALEDNAVFGYQARWEEYKWKPSRTSGYMRSTVTTPLDMWHLGQKFTSAPVLNDAFMQENPPVARALVVAQNHGESFLLDTMFEARWVRAMPMYSIPGLGGRL